MNKIEYKQAVYIGDEFERWHYWGFMPDLTFVGPDMSNGIAHALANSHPYVTDDKNGEKVFAGDRVKSGKRVLFVFWEEDDMQWKARVEGFKDVTPLCQWAISEQFELIKEVNP